MSVIFAPIMPLRLNHLLWGNVERHWPRRLLHIQTMTSYQRTGHATYNGVAEPEYSILAYTWGRFEDFDPYHEETLPIKGIPWRIPTIKSSHFTVEAFQTVLRRMGDRHEWAWIDIACINQDDDTSKMDQVGRQASIFRQAANSFVWLSRVPNRACSEALGAVDKAEDEWVVFETGTFDEQLATLRRLQESVVLVLDDPWFSSLWTLQEMVMRNDALILSSEGELVMNSFPRATVRQEYQQPLSMAKVSNDFANVWNNLVRI